MEPRHTIRSVCQKWGTEGLILLAYVALSLAMSYPLPLHMTTHIAGQHSDARVFQWNNWWVKHALLHHTLPTHTDYIYYPSGVSLLSHNINWVSSAISVPLDLLFGSTVAYNLTFLLTIFLSGFAMYLMTNYLVHRRDASFVAGVFFAFFPYHLSGNWDGQMNLANVQWLPLSALFVMRTLDSRRVRDALAAGFFAALAALDCWFFAPFLALWGALYALCARQAWSKRTVGLLSLAVVVAGALTAPLLVPMFAERDAFRSALGYYAEAKSADLLAFVIPSSSHPLLGGYVTPFYARFAHWRPAFLGYLPLLLALIAAFGAPRRAAFWLLSTLVFASLALGTTLHINGVAYPAVPTPYRLLVALLPPLKIIRQPNRFNVMVAFSLSVPVALGSERLAHLLSQVFHPPRSTPSDAHRCPNARRAAIGMLLALGVAFEFLAIPCPLSSNQLSPFYRALAGEPDDTVLLELPLDDFYSRRSLYPQTVHHKRLVNGYLARVPPTATAFIYNDPLLRALRIRMQVDPALHSLPDEMAVLSANGIRYVVIHTTPMPPHPAVEAEVLAEWERAFGPDPVYRDDEIVVYALPQPRQWLALPLDFADRLAALHVRARRVRLHPNAGETFLSVYVVWQARRDLRRDYACRLTFGDGQVITRDEARLIAPHYPTSRWRAGVVVADRYLLPLPSQIPEGGYTLSITLLDTASRKEVETYSLPVEITGTELLVPALSDVQTPTEVTFGDELRLLGYTPKVKEGYLGLDMYWLALRAMDTDYKMFVHLVRPTDGVIVAQRDAMPRDWSYPTSLWSRGEVFRDSMSLDISNVPAGEYLLAVGVYDPVEGRLPAADATGIPIPDGRAIMPTRIEVGR